jgi:hypothetical protein
MAWVSLRRYVDMRFKGVEDKTELAREAMEKRLDGMNEFRDTLSDQASRFVPRTEYNDLKDTVEGLTESRAELRGKASQNSVIAAYVIAAVSIIISVIALIR